MNILFKISYGLYLLSSRYGEIQNACMVNTVLQQTATPERISVTVNKENYTCTLIEKSKKFVVNILSKETNFGFIKNFGMQTGKNFDKFKAMNVIYTPYGIKTNKYNSLGYIELDVVDKIDMGTHFMFVGEISDKKTLEDGEPLTYAYYHSNIKPNLSAKPKEYGKEIWVCQICNYMHDGKLPDDFICPICKHGKEAMKKQE